LSVAVLRLLVAQTSRATRGLRDISDSPVAMTLHDSSTTTRGGTVVLAFGEAHTPELPATDSHRPCRRSCSVLEPPMVVDSMIAISGAAASDSATRMMTTMTTTLTLIRMDMGMAITRMGIDMAITRTPPAMGTTKATAVAM